MAFLPAKHRCISSVRLNHSVARFCLLLEENLWTRRKPLSYSFSVCSTHSLTSGKFRTFVCRFHSGYSVRCLGAFSRQIDHEGTRCWNYSSVWERSERQRWSHQNWRTSVEIVQWHAGLLNALPLLSACDSIVPTIRCTYPHPCSRIRIDQR